MIRKNKQFWKDKFLRADLNELNEVKVRNDEGSEFHSSGAETTVLC
jgi:hypothetical protein